MGSVNRHEGIQYQIEKIIIHYNYNKFNEKSDIALLKIKANIKLSAAVNSVCLPSVPFQEAVNTKGIITGWGRLSYGGRLPDILQEVSIPIISDYKCSKVYGLENTQIFNSQICTWISDSDACQVQISLYTFNIY